MTRETFEFPVKTDDEGNPKISGDKLSDEIVTVDAAITDVSIVLVGNTVQVAVEREDDFTDDQRQAIEDVFEAHTGEPDLEEIAEQAEDEETLALKDKTGKLTDDERDAAIRYLLGRVG